MGRPPKDHRLIVGAIVWLDQTGAPWRDLPSQFGPWEMVASRFCRWRRQGIWAVAVAPLSTLRRLRRIDVPSALRVAE